MSVQEKNAKGLSPLIASVLTILFGVLMLVVVLNVINPVFERAGDSSIVTDAFQNLNLIHSVIEEVASEAQGSKRTVSVSVSEGDYSINTTTDLLMFEYNPSESMNLRGSRGDIDLEYGIVFLDYFNWYVDGSKALPVWTNNTGRWAIDNYKYQGDGGAAYHNISLIESVRFSGDIYNSSGTGGQIFVTPTDPKRLVGFWGFDNYTGSKAYDFSGNMNNGTLPAGSDFPTVGNSSSGWQGASSCKAGSCMQFDGVNDYIDCGGQLSLNISGEISISAWVNPLRTDDLDAIVSKEDSSNAYALAAMSDGKFRMYIGDGDLQYAESDTAFSEGSWYHVVGTYNGSHIQIYVNGDLEGSPAAQSSPVNTDVNLRIGSKPDSSNYFNGTIDEVRLWNISLTDDEVTAEYHLSQNKLLESGFKSAGVKMPKAAIVLSNPDGVTSFDNIKVSKDVKEQTFVIPYSRIDLNGTFRISKGEHRVTVEHMGTNTTLDKPIIEVTSS